MEQTFTESQLKMAMHKLLLNLTPDKFEIFYKDLCRQLDENDELIPAVQAVIESSPEIRTVGRDDPYQDISDLFREVTDLQDLLNAGSDFDWINGWCYFSELQYDLIDDYLNRAAYVRDDSDREASKEILSSYLDRGRVVQNHFRALMLYLRLPETDPQEAIWRFERMMVLNDEAAKTHKTFNWVKE